MHFFKEFFNVWTGCAKYLINIMYVVNIYVKYPQDFWDETERLL